VVTNDGCHVPINIVHVLPCVRKEPSAAAEFDKLPHVVLTQGGEWDPAALCHVITDDED